MKVINLKVCNLQNHPLRVTEVTGQPLKNGDEVRVPAVELPDYQRRYPTNLEISSAPYDVADDAAPYMLLAKGAASAPEKEVDVSDKAEEKVETKDAPADEKVIAEGEADKAVTKANKSMAGKTKTK